MRLKVCTRQVFCTDGVALSGLRKCLTLVSLLWSVQSQSGKDGCRRWGLCGTEVRDLQNGRNDLLFSFPRMEQQKGLLLLLLGLQLLLMGLFLYQNHRHHGFTSLHFLIQDKPEVGEELPFVAQVSSLGIPHQDVYSNISQIHHVDTSREDLPNCPIISPYISKLVGGLLHPNPTSGFGSWQGIAEEGAKPGSRSCGPGGFRWRES